MKTKTRRAQDDELTAEDRAYLGKMKALSPDARGHVKMIIDACFTQLEAASQQESAKIVEGLALHYPACGERRKGQRRVRNDLYNPSAPASPGRRKEVT